MEGAVQTRAERTGPEPAALRARTMCEAFQLTATRAR